MKTNDYSKASGGYTISNLSSIRFSLLSLLPRKRAVKTVARFMVLMFCLSDREC